MGASLPVPGLIRYMFAAMMTEVAAMIAQVFLQLAALHRLSLRGGHFSDAARIALP